MSQHLLWKHPMVSRLWMLKDIWSHCDMTQLRNIDNFLMKCTDLTNLWFAENIQDRHLILPTGLPFSSQNRTHEYSHLHAYTLHSSKPVQWACMGTVVALHPWHYYKHTHWQNMNDPSCGWWQRWRRTIPHTACNSLQWSWGGWNEMGLTTGQRWARLSCCFQC